MGWLRWLCALIGLPTWTPMAIVAVAGIGLVGGAYLKGRMDAKANCREASLMLEINQLKRDVSLQKAAEAVEEAQRKQLEAEATRLQQEVERYVAELRARPADGRCLLTDDDIRGLRGR